MEHEATGIDERDHMPMPGGRLTGATVTTVRDHLLERGLLFRLDDEGIARHFTQFFFSGEAWRVDLGVLRDVVSNLDGCPVDIPANPVEFATWVRRKLLEFDHLPRCKLNELREWASEDLASILANIKYCKARLADLDKRNPKAEGDQSEVGFYRHYLKKNSEARDEIVEVLAHRIEREALRAAYGPLVPGMIDFHVPWAFRWFPDRYSAECYSEVAHAFLELPLAEFQEIQDLYRGERWTEFDQALALYVQEHDPAAAVRALIDRHHLLAARRSVLVPALCAYERGERALFASAVAVQIEGIFEDACRMSGVSLDELRVATLVPKLDTLLRTKDVRIDYTYYAFKFPLLRNRVAHGRMLETDLHRTTQLLLLDLHDACRVVASHPGPQNALVQFLRNKTPMLASVLDAVGFAVLYAETEGEKPNDFYGLSDSFDEMLALLDRPLLWNALESLVTHRREELDSGVRFLANRMKKARSHLGARCKRVLGGLGDRGDGPFDKGEFMSAVRAIPGHSRSVFSDEEIRALLLGVLRSRQQWRQTAETPFLW